jgi:hypothetical protein
MALAQRVPKMNLQVVRCHGCGSTPAILLVNGQEEILFCKTCAERECGEMVLANDNISFRQEKRDDGLILVIVE